MILKHSRERQIKRSWGWAYTRPLLLQVPRWCLRLGGAYMMPLPLPQALSFSCSDCMLMYSSLISFLMVRTAAADMSLASWTQTQTHRVIQFLSIKVFIWPQTQSIWCSTEMYTSTAPKHTPCRHRQVCGAPYWSALAWLGKFGCSLNVCFIWWFTMRPWGQVATHSLWKSHVSEWWCLSTNSVT